MSIMHNDMVGASFYASASCGIYARLPLEGKAEGGVLMRGKLTNMYRTRDAAAQIWHQKCPETVPEVGEGHCATSTTRVGPSAG